MSTIPSYLKICRTNPSKNDNEHFTNNSLRTGVVLKSYYPTDPKNFNKQYMEYDVKVAVRNGLNTREVDTLYRCVCANPLGSTDYVKFSLRTDPGNTQSSQYAQGANVL